MELSDRRPGDWNQLHRAAATGLIATTCRRNRPRLKSRVVRSSLSRRRHTARSTERFVELAGGRDAQFVVYPTAMPDPINIGLESSFLKRAGVQQRHYPSVREETEVDSVDNLDVLKKATGVWFGGGRQWRFVDAYEGTKTAKLLRDVLRRAV